MSTCSTTTAASNIVGTYRCYLRQIRRLPIPYLRQFWQVKAADNIRAALRSTDKIREKRVKRVKKDLRRIEAANNGGSRAFEHVLELAYGRKGKLKRELMEPRLSDPNAPVPPRIIPQVESSRPPVYSPELRALVASSTSCRGKLLSQKSLDNPPTLPSRADPTSEDARLLGPFSKRREVNLRWRYFTKASSKVFPPLKMLGIPEDIRRKTTRYPNLDSWGSHIHDEADALADFAVSKKNLTRKEMLRGDEAAKESLDIERHPSRWLRRRYQHLLASMPILKYSQSKQPSTCSVTASSSRIVKSDAFSPHRFRELQRGDAMNWIEHARRNSTK